MVDVKGLTMGKDKVEIMYLQFADDTIFFLQPEVKNFQWVVNILKLFCNMSGLKLNLEKSSLLGLNMDQQRISSMASLVGCKHEE